ncbi:uncharacterized protein [Miscanthus floridulus]|uniref:uncharacterized protein isoform X2 n=1 Tax=Miscanthus floridulus TaxID=154761 RepID=UPI0034595CD7
MRGAAAGRARRGSAAGDGRVRAGPGVRGASSLRRRVGPQAAAAARCEEAATSRGAAGRRRQQAAAVRGVAGCTASGPRTLRYPTSRTPPSPLSLARLRSVLAAKNAATDNLLAGFVPVTALSPATEKVVTDDPILRSQDHRSTSPHSFPHDLLNVWLPSAPVVATVAGGRGHGLPRLGSRSRLCHYCNMCCDKEKDDGPDQIYPKIHGLGVQEAYVKDGGKYQKYKRPPAAEQTLL